LPWFPDFVSAVELARMQLRAAGRADPVAQYVQALAAGTSRELEAAWPGRVIVYDPRAGEVRGHRQLRRFVEANAAWLAGQRARVETVATTTTPGRAVVELVAHLNGDGWGQAWPVAVVAESIDDLSVVFRTYCSQQPVDGRRHLRSPILEPGPGLPDDVVGRYHEALDNGDVAGVVGAFASDGYYREPIGAHNVHRGADELRSYFTRSFSDGGGIELTPCVVTDDGTRCAVEYNCVRWGGRQLSPQAGIAVFDRATDGLLAAARIYDDIEPPADLR
jgi:hypothetical protein